LNPQSHSGRIIILNTCRGKQSCGEEVGRQDQASAGIDPIGFRRPQ